MPSTYNLLVNELRRSQLPQLKDKEVNSDAPSTLSQEVWEESSSHKVNTRSRSSGDMESVLAMGS